MSIDRFNILSTDGRFVGYPAGMEEISLENQAKLLAKVNEQQMLFVRAFVGNGGDKEAAAKAAGYSDTAARSYAYELLAKPHVRAAVFAEQQRVIQTDGASTALAFLLSVVADKGAATGARVDAAKFIINLAGHVAPKAPEAAEGRERELADLTVEELEQIIRDGRKVESAFDAAAAPILDGQSQPIDIVQLSHHKPGDSVPLRDVTPKQGIDI